MTLLTLCVLFGYFALLLVVSRRSGGAATNDNFFRAGRRASWPMVAFGMIGASISGVSLISVPGWVASTGMSYLQMCAGFFVGYLFIAFVLLPVYYKLRLTSIYTYLSERFGPRSHKTGALFFILSKLTGAAARLYLACIVLFTALLPLSSNLFPLASCLFPLLVAAILLMIWLYTRRSGIGAIVRTDALQTLCMLLAAVGICWAVCSQLHFSLADAWRLITDAPANDAGFSMSTVFVWDAASKQFFWRQFLSGMFITIVMTGLDQDMMQKNLTCSSLRDAQKDMCSYGIAFLPVNALFLGLGVLLYHYCAVSGIAAPERGDDLLPMLVGSGALGVWVVVPFIIGITAAAFSSADSAITSLTTSVCVDFFERDNDEALRRRIHIGVIAAFFVCILAFRVINSSNAIDAIYTMAGYTYGPLLGLFFFGLFVKTRVRDSWVPAVAIASPIICGLLDHFAPILWNYHFGYELLMLNGLLTAAGLMALRKR